MTVPSEISGNSAASRPSAAAERYGEPGAARAVLITGAARRIGRALALGFAVRGWDVAVHFSASREDAEALVAEIGALGRRAVALQADLAVEAEVARLVPACVAAFGRLTCVVNNASRFEEDT